jgi:hypothetical protein
MPRSANAAVAVEAVAAETGRVAGETVPPDPATMEAVVAREVKSRRFGMRNAITLPDRMLIRGDH